MKSVGRLLGHELYLETEDEQKIEMAKEMLAEAFKVNEVAGHDLLITILSIVNPNEKPTNDRRRKLNARLKEYTEEEIIAAATAFSKSEWHRENKQMSIDNLLAPSKFGRWYAASHEAEERKFV